MKNSNPGDSYSGIVRPVRITLSRKKGWRMPSNTVKVCRPGKFGNPFVVGVDGTAAECVEKFAMDIYHPTGRVGFEVDDVATLRGKNLACWCKRGAPCHADVLLELANAQGDSQSPAKNL
jgi:hypothetical protein